MSNAVSAKHPAGVPRFSYQQLRMLLALAAIVIVGLSVAVVLLATNNHDIPGYATQASIVSHSGATADTGARLDHRGLHDAAYLSGLDETGARLDHRGLHASSTH